MPGGEGTEAVDTATSSGWDGGGGGEAEDGGELVGGGGRGGGGGGHDFPSIAHAETGTGCWKEGDVGE